MGIKRKILPFFFFSLKMDSKGYSNTNQSTDSLESLSSLSSPKFPDLEDSTTRFLQSQINKQLTPDEVNENVQDQSCKINGINFSPFKTPLLNPFKKSNRLFTSSIYGSPFSSSPKLSSPISTPLIGTQPWKQKNRIDENFNRLESISYTYSKTPGFQNKQIFQKSPEENDLPQKLFEIVDENSSSSSLSTPISIKFPTISNEFFTLTPKIKLISQEKLLDLSPLMNGQYDQEEDELTKTIRIEILKDLSSLGPIINIEKDGPNNLENEDIGKIQDELFPLNELMETKKNVENVEKKDVENVENKEEVSIEINPPLLKNKNESQDDFKKNQDLSEERLSEVHLSVENLCESDLKTDQDLSEQVMQILNLKSKISWLSDIVPMFSIDQIATILKLKILDSVSVHEMVSKTLQILIEKKVAESIEFRESSTEKFYRVLKEIN